MAYPATSYSASCLPGRYHALHTRICLRTVSRTTWPTPSTPSTVWRLAHPAVIDVRFATTTSSCPPTWPTSRSTSWPTARRACRSACCIAQLFSLCTCLNLGRFSRRCLGRRLGRCFSRCFGRRGLWIEVKECWID